MKNTLLLSLVALFILVSCYAPQAAKVARTGTKEVGVFYSQAPTESYQEIGIVNTNFRERGYVTGTGSSELIVAKLQDEAEKIGADAIINVKIESEVIAKEMNKIWTGSAVAIKFN